MVTHRHAYRQDTWLMRPSSGSSSDNRLPDSESHGWAVLQKKSDLDRGYICLPCMSKNNVRGCPSCQPRKQQGDVRLEVVTWRLYCANRAHHLQLPLCRPLSSGSHQVQAPQLSCVISQRSTCTERQQDSLGVVVRHNGCSSGSGIVLARGPYPALS